MLFILLSIIYLMDISAFDMEGCKRALQQKYYSLMSTTASGRITLDLSTDRPEGVQPNLQECYFLRPTFREAKVNQKTIDRFSQFMSSSGRKVTFDHPKAYFGYEYSMNREIDMSWTTNS